MSAWRSMEVPENLKKMSPKCRGYKKGSLSVFISPSEPMGDSNFIKQNGVHLSIAHPHRYPTWQEIKEARYLFMPEDKDAYMVLPKKEDYINEHPNCFHIWMPSDRLIIGVK